MSSPSLADLQSLLHEIDEALSEPASRWRLSFAGKNDRQRQLLERTREFLISLQSQWSQPLPPPETKSESESNSHDIGKGSTPVPTPVEDWRSQLQDIRATLLGSLQTEVEDLQQQRQDLLQELRQLEAKRAQYHSLAAQQDQQQKLISQFLERLLERLQPTLKAQMAKTLQKLETQFLSLEATPSEISSDHHPPGAASASEKPATQSESGDYPLHPADRLQKLRQLQARSDRMLQDLDATLQVVFDSLLQNTRSYEQSLSQSLSQMYNLGQQGESIVAALVDAMVQQTSAASTIAEQAPAVRSLEDEKGESTDTAHTPPKEATQPTASSNQDNPPTPTPSSEDLSPTSPPSTDTTKTENEPTPSPSVGGDTEAMDETSDSSQQERSHADAATEEEIPLSDEDIENDYSDIEALEASLFADQSTNASGNQSATNSAWENTTLQPERGRSGPQTEDLAEEELDDELDDEDLTFFQDFWSQSEASEEIGDTNYTETQQSLATSLFATEETVEQAPDFFQAASQSLESTSEIPTDSSWEEAAEFFQTASQSLETVEDFQEPETIYNEETPEDFEVSASESEASNKPAVNWLETITSLDELVTELENSILPWHRGDRAQSSSWSNPKDVQSREAEGDEYVAAIEEENLLPQEDLQQEGPLDLSLGDTTLQRLQQDLSSLEISAPPAGEEDSEDATRIQFLPDTETPAMSTSASDEKTTSSRDRDLVADTGSQEGGESQPPAMPEQAEEEDDDDDEATVLLDTKATPGGQPIATETTTASSEPEETAEETEVPSQGVSPYPSRGGNNSSESQNSDRYVTNVTSNGEEDLLAALSAATPPEIKKADTESDWWNWESVETETPTPSSADEDLFADLEAAAEAETDEDPTSTSNGTNDLFYREASDRSSGKKKPS